MVDQRKGPGQRAYRLPGWFFVVTGVASVLGIALAAWVLIANPFATSQTQTATPDPTATADPSVAPDPTLSDGVADPASDLASDTDTDAEPAGTGADDELRGGTEIVVLNGTTTAGLAATVAKTASDAGWTVEKVGNWPYPVAQNAVFYPQGLEDEGKLLGRDLDITSVRPIRPGMSDNQLTVILLNAP